MTFQVGLRWIIIQETGIVVTILGQRGVMFERNSGTPSILGSQATFARTEKTKSVKKRGIKAWKTRTLRQDI